MCLLKKNKKTLLSHKCPARNTRDVLDLPAALSEAYSVSAVSSDVQVTIACDAVLNAPSAYKKQEPESWEEDIQVSRHARSLRQLDNGVRIPPRCEKLCSNDICSYSRIVATSNVTFASSGFFSWQGCVC